VQDDYLVVEWRNHCSAPNWMADFGRPRNAGGTNGAGLRMTPSGPARRKSVLNARCARDAVSWWHARRSCAVVMSDDPIPGLRSGHCWNAHVNRDERPRERRAPASGRVNAAEHGVRDGSGSGQVNWRAWATRAHLQWHA